MKQLEITITQIIKYIPNPKYYDEQLETEQDFLNADLQSDSKTIVEWAANGGGDSCVILVSGRVIDN